MLNSIRKSANSFLIKIILVMIVFAFIGWGIKDVLQDRKNFDLVTFDKAKNITENDFLVAKSNEISMLQRQNNANLSEADIKQLGIEKIILQELINDSMLMNIAQHYDLKLSEETIIYYMKQSPLFRNERGEFDPEILQLYFKGSTLHQEKYIQNLNDKILKNIVISTFLEPFHVPDIMVQNILNFMVEQRVVEIAEFDLKNVDKNTAIISPTTDQVKDFYHEHQELFTKKETRSFLYTKIEPSVVEKKVVITDKDIIDFYNENKEESKYKEFDRAKNQVISDLRQQKIANLMIEFAKNLEEDVAGGSTLKEIAAKYELKLNEEKDVTYEDIAGEKSQLDIVVDSIFEMSEGEVLYPVELQDNKGLILVELQDIKPSELQAYEIVQEKALNLLNLKLIAHANIKYLEDIATKYKTDYRNIPKKIKELVSKNVKLNLKASLIRSELEKEDKLPQGLLVAIFNTPQDNTTKVFRSTDKAYFAYVKEIKTDPRKLLDVKKLETNIISSIKNAVVEELINYFIKTNNMHINFKDQLLQ